jgi:type I restriction enzyme S subunit
VGEVNLPLLGVGLHEGVRQRDDGDGRPAASEDLSDYKIVQEGDLIMNRLGKPHGSVGVSPWSGITSPAYWVIKIDRNRAYPAFIHHLLRSKHMVREYERLGKYMPPNQFDISWDAFRSIEVPLPSLDQQRRIADFLDAETARIDALIEKKQHMIGFLDERSQALINQVCPGAMVHGLDGRPMGIAGMKCVRLGAIAAIHGGFTMDAGRDNGADFVTSPYLRVANVQDGSLALDDIKEVTLPRALAERCTLRPGDVLMTEGGDPDKLGRGTVWRGDLEPCLHQNAIFAVRPDSRLLPEYLALVTRTQYARAYFEMTASKSTGIAHTSSTKITGFRVPQRPVAEQRRVVRRAHEGLARIEAPYRLAEWQVSLLAERRQALITAAVTGQIDVSTAGGLVSAGGAGG